MPGDGLAAPAPHFLSLPKRTQGCPVAEAPSLGVISPPPPLLRVLPLQGLTPLGAPPAALALSFPFCSCRCSRGRCFSLPTAAVPAPGCQLLPAGLQNALLRAGGRSHPPPLNLSRLFQLGSIISGSHNSLALLSNVTRIISC